MDLTKLECAILGDVWTSSALWDTLRHLCDACNGRFAGTEDERRAAEFALARFQKDGLQNAAIEPFDMRGWQRGEARLELLDGGTARTLPCMALAGSPAGEVTAEMVDAGPGTPADFERLGDSVAGKAVLASAEGPHRLEKYARACAAGATGFVFASAQPGMLIPAGSLGMGQEPAHVPGIGIAFETEALLRRCLQDGQVRVRLSAAGRSQQVTAHNVVAELPGSDPDAGWIVVCGHYDGHDIAQGAQDNATGTAIVLESARLLAPLRAHLRAGIRFVLFSGEELGMFGSQAYVRAHADELDRIRAVFNADIVGLAAPLVLMSQNSPELAAYLRQLDLSGLDAQVVDARLVAYSDHFSFTLAGVSSLMAVTSSPGSGRGWAHSAADTLDKLELRPLREAAATTARILLHMALQPEGLPERRRSTAEVRDALVAADLEQPLRLQGRWPF